MALLPHTQILKLHTAVISAALTTSRAALLGGIDPALSDALPTCASASSQVLSDLHALNAAGQLSDGAAPLKIWLGNALALVGQRVEADVFRSALAVTESPEAPTRHAEGQGAPERVDEIAEELSRIGRAVLLARGDDLTRCLYEVDALLARCPHHVEARMLRERINRAVEEVPRGMQLFDVGELGTPRGATHETYWDPASEGRRKPLAPPIDFTGRVRELAELMEKIGPGGVAISGLEGVGKTVLALKLAQLLAPSYPCTVAHSAGPSGGLCPALRWTHAGPPLARVARRPWAARRAGQGQSRGADGVAGP